MERTLEQVIMDVAAHNWSSFVDKEDEAAAIAEAVRGWLDELVKGEGHPYQSVVRIKELESEVARLASLKSSPGCCDKAAKYDELRAKFPFLPGEGDRFYFARGARIKWGTVQGVFVKDDCGEMIPLYECHPTADACRAAIPVEE